MSTFHIKVGKDQLPETLHSVLSMGQWKSPKTSQSQVQNVTVRTLQNWFIICNLHQILQSRNRRKWHGLKLQRM